ncbi:hypothetical protein GGF46_000461 [Coemansia sp. RSA 552]|nr:hypothetical protein GGF46_000461 [Coemansia sp. RSA 552]
MSSTSDARIAPAEAATVADIEQKILAPRAREQEPGLRTAHRQFLELHDLLAAAHEHGAPRIQRGLLVGQARTLLLPTGGGPLDTGIDRLAAPFAAHGSAAPSADTSDICACIEAKQVAVAQLPGIEAVGAGPKEPDVAKSQCQLLSTHAQYIGELVSEAELLAGLCRHATDHPIYSVARGLERYFGGLIDSLSLKLQIIAAEMHQTLYSPDVLRAIESLAGILRAREASLASEQSALDERLAIYRDAGGEFQEIATAYSAVLRATEEIRRDIARIAQL